MSKNRYVCFLSASLLSLLVTACGVLKSGEAEYERSQADIPLQVPEDLKNPKRDTALVVPR